MFVTVRHKLSAILHVTLQHNNTTYLTAEKHNSHHSLTFSYTCNNLSTSCTQQGEADRPPGEAMYSDRPKPTATSIFVLK